jgi:hypothetical protein
VIQTGEVTRKKTWRFKRETFRHGSLFVDLISKRDSHFFQKNACHKLYFFEPATDHVEMSRPTRRRTSAAPAAATSAPLATPPHISILDQLPILTVDQRHDLLVRYFAHHDRPADTPEQRATALGAWLDAAVQAVPAARPDDVLVAMADTPASRRQAMRFVATLPVVGPVTHLVEVLRPSGRFDALVDMGNPMKGINLFPFLQRRVEGRALKAMGPVAALELSRTVCEVVLPRRWPREVCYNSYIFIIGTYLFDIKSVFLLLCFRCKVSGSAPLALEAINPANSTRRAAWR